MRIATHLWVADPDSLATAVAKATFAGQLVGQGYLFGRAAYATTNATTARRAEARRVARATRPPKVEAAPVAIGFE